MGKPHFEVEILINCLSIVLYRENSPINGKQSQTRYYCSVFPGIVLKLFIDDFLPWYTKNAIFGQTQKNEMRKE